MDQRHIFRLLEIAENSARDALEEYGSFDTKLYLHTGGNVDSLTVRHTTAEEMAERMNRALMRARAAGPDFVILVMRGQKNLGCKAGDKFARVVVSSFMSRSHLQSRCFDFEIIDGFVAYGDAINVNSRYVERMKDIIYSCCSD